MVPRLVPEISSLDAFCDTAAGAAVGIGDSRSWMQQFQPNLLLFQKWKYEEEAGRPQATNHLSFSASILSNYWTPQRHAKSNVGPELKCSEEPNFRYLRIPLLEEP